MSRRRWAAALTYYSVLALFPGLFIFLTASKDVKAVGTETVGGVDTTLTMLQEAHQLCLDRGDLTAPLIVDALGWRRVLGSGYQPPDRSRPGSSPSTASTDSRGFRTAATPPRAASSRPSRARSTSLSRGTGRSAAASPCWR